jgi:hypothetical protein
MIMPIDYSTPVCTKRYTLKKGSCSVSFEGDDALTIYIAGPPNGWGFHCIHETLNAEDAKALLELLIAWNAGNYSR